MSVLLVLLLSACEFGAERSELVSPNYHLLGDCERPDNPRVTAIVAEARCGQISVWENRETEQGRRIDLNVMLLPATTAVVKPDPIFFLAGGPGQSAVDAGPYLFTVLHKLQRERDIVLVDQRGTGESNPLVCADDEIFNFEYFDLSLDEVMARETEAMRDCLATVDADPSRYTTPVAMDDLNEVREVLGYNAINLLGGSYGTRAGLVYLRRHGQTVRSAVLDGLAPLTMRIPANVALDAQAAFDQLVEDCHAQPGCAQAFPDLREHLRELVERHREEDLSIDFSHPRTAEHISGKVDHRLFNRLIRSVLYERTLSSLIPLAIEQAYVGNFEPLNALAFSFSGDEPLISMGMMASVLCAEDMTRVSEASASEDFDNPIYEILDPVCEFWPAGSIPENYFQPVESQVPVLLLSGKLDPITPPKYGWEAAATLPNSEHIIVAGVGHGVMTQGCVPNIIADFFDSPNPREVKAACTATLTRKDFFTGFAGPTQPLEEGKLP